MNYPTRETVAMLRQQYPAGTRVELVEMDDPYTRLRPGDRGEVTFVDDAGGVHIRWDKGEGLAAVWGKDIINKIPSQRVCCLNCGHEFDGIPEYDDLGWHCSCPECGGSFDVDKEGAV